MSIMAGIVSRRSNCVIPDVLFSELTESLNKHRNGKLITHSSPQAKFAKVDLGILGSEGFHINMVTGSFGMVTGEPYLLNKEENKIYSREDDLCSLCAQCDKLKWDIFENASGIYSFAYFNPTHHNFTLTTDKHGIRPIYIWSNNDYLIFSSLLRVFEEFRLIPKTMDIMAVAQIIRLGYPLGRLSPYSGIEVLESAEQVIIKNDTLERRYYYRWDIEKESYIPEKEIVKEAHNRFISAVRRRLKGQKKAVSFLSGGLDSRTVAGALRELDVDVRSFGFALPGTQDDVYAQMFAEKAGFTHTAIGRKSKGIELHKAQWSFAIANILAEESLENQSPNKFHLVWSGDGGSAPIGCVFVYPQIIECMRKGEIKKAIDFHLRSDFSGISKKMIKPAIYKQIFEATEKGIEIELGKIECKDPVRRFHLFLMKNDQRRHLSSHFETIDQHGVEFLLPLFDSHFHDLILHLPIELCLYHRFYHKWLQKMHSSVIAVPWQTYPSHEPCPVPGLADIKDQWATSKNTFLSDNENKAIFHQGRSILKEKDFPHPIIDRTSFRFLYWAHRLGLRDSSFAINTIEPFIKYWKISNGVFVL